MLRESQGVTPVGVSLSARALQAFLSLSPGVTALYGKNGAGKTRVLDEIASLFRGRTDFSSWLYVYVDPSVSVGRGLDTHPVLDALPSRPFEFGSTESMETWTIEEAVRWGLAKGPHNLVGDERYDAFLDEVSRQHMLAISARPPWNSAFGDNRPTWHVFAAVQIDATTPVLCEERDDVLSDWTEWREAVIEDDGDQQRADMLLSLKDAETDRLPLLEEPYVEYFFDVDEPPMSLDDWPPFPIPIELGSTPTLFVTLFDESVDDAEAATLDVLRETLRDPNQRFWDADGHLPLTETETTRLEECSDLLSRVVDTANELIALVLLDAPRLRCLFQSVDQWLGNARPLQWQLLDAPSGSWVNVEDGSRAQRRWANFAISAALVERVGQHGHAILLMDEPELALHPAAQEHMARGLSLLADRITASVIVATHSPTLLAQPQIRLVHVHRKLGVSVVSELPGITRDNLDELGLRPNDHLLMQRTVLLVEGVHDQWVLDHFLGDELLRQRVWTIPLHGGRHAASAVDATVLLDFTDARMVVALDKLRNDEISPAWDAVRMGFGADGVEAALVLLDSLFPKRKKKEAEDKYLYDLFRRAIEEGVAERIEVFGFSKPDILDYLPIEDLVPSAHRHGKSWDDLHDEHERDQSAAGKANFKTWTDGHYASSLRDDTFVQTVIEALPRSVIVDDEFYELVEFCRVVPQPADEAAT
jgi:AAA domain, putative AbiEii toxin, Type IV TA system